ncbi:MAG TPA: hypothetical protein DCL21_01550 [Alphaproteobacteria bacterium]|nr:hypothetical protein [Alphaproteobacteria bacterium]
MNVHEFLDCEFRRVLERDLCIKALDFSKHIQAQKFLGKPCINKETGEKGIVVFMIVAFFEDSQTDLKTFCDKYGPFEDDDFFKFFTDNGLQTYPIFLSKEDEKIEIYLKSLNQTSPEGCERLDEENVDSLWDLLAKIKTAETTEEKENLENKFIDNFNSCKDDLAEMLALIEEKPILSIV